MDNGIGYYIHLRQFNYYRAGINRLTDGDFSNLNNSSIESQVSNRQMVINKIESLSLTNDSQELKSIEAAIQKIIKPSSKSEKGYSTRVWKIITDLLEEEFGTLGDAIVKETANVIPLVEKSSINKGQGRSLSKISTKYTGQGEGTRSIKLRTILTALADINSTISRIKSVSTKEEITNQINNIYSRINEMYAIEESVLRDAGVAFQTLYDSSNKRRGGSAKRIVDLKGQKVDLSQFNEERLYTGDVKALVDDINEIIQVVQGLTNVIKGKMFEYIVAAAAWKLGYAGRKTVAEFLKSDSTLVGDSKTKIIMSGDIFAENVDKDIVFQGFEQVGPNLWRRTNSSQDKIDIDFGWKDGSNLKASVKNINLQNNYNIHLVSGGDFKSMISQYNDNNFVNHYLNLTVERRNDPQGYLNGPREAAIETMELVLLQGAIQGYKETAGKANIFIVNDNKTGKVRVLSIGEIIMNIVNNIEKLDSSVNITLGGQSVASVRYSNDKSYIGWADRINQIIAQLSALKVNVQLKKSVIN